MRITVFRRSGVAALAIAFGLLVGISIAPVTAATPFVKDVYFAAGYERQVDNRTCVAASTAMMLNFIAGRDLRLDQLGILRWAQPRDALDNSVQRGTDPLGWSKALTQFSGTTGRSFSYRWEAHGSETAALRAAAKYIAATGRPVGVTVANGRHAVVMTGFEATRDPRQGDFTVIAVRISDPNGTSHRRYLAKDSPTTPYLERDATTAYDSAWYGKYVIVVPEGRVALSRG